jgi:hypothetical protein
MLPGAKIKHSRGRSPEGEKSGSYPDLALFAELQNESETIGSSYYYITINAGVPSLVRWQSQGSGVHFHEEVNHETYAITDEDLHDAVRQDAFSDEESGISRISDHIANKLRVFYGV